MRSALGENDMMAYLAMMAVRLIELHRVRKPTGSLYFHCDVGFMEDVMNGIIYLVGLIVIIMTILAFLGLR
jgi:hypothetical protein